VLQVKPYPVQANYAITNSTGAHTAQPGRAQQPHVPQPLTNFLDIVSTSPFHMIEDFIQKDASIVHQKGELKSGCKVVVVVVVVYLQLVIANSLLCSLYVVLLI